jgi:hypothetical protein
MAENDLAGLSELVGVKADFVSRRNHVISIPDHATLRALKNIAASASSEMTRL